MAEIETRVKTHETQEKTVRQQHSRDVPRDARRRPEVDAGVCGGEGAASGGDGGELRGNRQNPMGTKEERRMKKPKKREWIVQMRCEVTKEVIVGPCTQAEAEEDPFSFEIEERETGQDDYVVLSVEANE
jgi:hypothetical protein